MILDQERPHLVQNSDMLPYQVYKLGRAWYKLGRAGDLVALVGLKYFLLLFIHPPLQFWDWRPV